MPSMPRSIGYLIISGRLMFDDPQRAVSPQRYGERSDDDCAEEYRAEAALIVRAKGRWDCRPQEWMRISYPHSMEDIKTTLESRARKIYHAYLWWLHPEKNIDDHYYSLRIAMELCRRVSCNGRVLPLEDAVQTEILTKVPLIEVKPRWQSKSLEE